METNPNFRRIAQELVDHYGTDAAVAEIIGCKLTTIWRIRAGRRQAPSWQLGDKLIRLHDKIGEKAV